MQILLWIQKEQERCADITQSVDKSYPFDTLCERALDQSCVATFKS
jgi:hypothetical protein